MFKIILDKDIKTHKQYSKVWMTRWQVFCMFWLSVFFVADIWLNQCIHLETLCITLVTSVVPTILGYFCKAYLETKEEKRLQYKYQMNPVNNVDIVDSLEEVG